MNGTPPSCSDRQNSIIYRLRSILSSYRAIVQFSIVFAVDLFNARTEVVQASEKIAHLLLLLLLLLFYEIIFIYLSQKYFLFW